MANHMNGLLFNIKFVDVNKLTDDLGSIKIGFAFGQLNPKFLFFEGKWNIRHEELNNFLVVEANVVIPREGKE